MLEIKIKLRSFLKRFKSEKFNKNLKILALFSLGFLLGIMFKFQAFKNLVIGYDDHKIFKDDKVVELIGL